MQTFLTTGVRSAAFSAGNTVRTGLDADILSQSASFCDSLRRVREFSKRTVTRRFLRHASPDESGGYQLLGCSCGENELVEKGLTEGQKDVAVAQFCDAATQVLRELELEASTIASYSGERTCCIREHRRVWVEVVFPNHAMTTCTRAFLGASGLSRVVGYVDQSHVRTIEMQLQKYSHSSKIAPGFMWQAVLGKVTKDAERQNFITMNATELQLYISLVHILFLGRLAARLTTSPCEMIKMDFGDNNILHGYYEVEESPFVQAIRNFVNFGADEDGAAVPLLPAEDFDGDPYEATLITTPDSEHQMLEAAENVKFKAAFCGPNITCARPPIDTLHPVTIASALSRHVSQVKKSVKLAGGGTVDIVVDKLSNKTKKLPTYKVEAIRDLDLLEAERFKEYIRGSLVMDGVAIDRRPPCPWYDMTAKPHRMSDEVFEDCYGAVLQDILADEWGPNSDAEFVEAFCFCKAGEGGTRARFITLPGKSPSDAHYHQAAMSPLVKTLERFQLVCFNHRNTKGLNNDGINQRLGGFATVKDEYGTDALAREYVAMGFDKSANDRTWTREEWIYFVRHLRRMADILIHETGIETWIPEPFRASLENRDVKFRMRFAGFVLILDGALWYFFSGISPTTYANSWNTLRSHAAAIRQMTGEEGYRRFLAWCVDPRPIFARDDDDELEFMGNELFEDSPGGGFSPGNHEGAFYLTGRITVRPRRRIVTLAPADEFIINNLNNFEPGPTPLMVCVCGDDSAATLHRGPRCKATPQEIISRYQRALQQAVPHEVWVASIVDGPFINARYHRKGVVEMLSRVVITMDGVPVGVPKPMKRLDKLAWTLSPEFTFVENNGGVAVVKDQTYHRINATRCFSMCIELVDTLFLRHLFFKTACMHLDMSKKIGGENASVPLYTKSSMEGRGLPDATLYVGQSMTEFANRYEEILNRSSISCAVLTANHAAWCVENPELMTVNTRELMVELVALDQTMAQIHVDDELVNNPEQLFMQLPVKNLASVFAKAQTRLTKAFESAGEHKDAEKCLKLVKDCAARAKSSEPRDKPAGDDDESPEVPTRLDVCGKDGEEEAPSPAPDPKKKKNKVGQAKGSNDGSAPAGRRGRKARA